MVITDYPPKIFPGNIFYTKGCTDINGIVIPDNELVEFKRWAYLSDANECIIYYKNIKGIVNDACVPRKSLKFYKSRIKDLWENYLHYKSELRV